MAFFIVMLSVVMVNVSIPESCYDECFSAESHYTEFQFAECLIQNDVMLFC